MQRVVPLTRCSPYVYRSIKRIHYHLVQYSPLLFVWFACDGIGVTVRGGARTHKNMEIKAVNAAQKVQTTTFGPYDNMC